MDLKEFAEYSKAEAAIRRYLTEADWKYYQDGIWLKGEYKAQMPVYFFNGPPSMLDRLANVIDQIAAAEELSVSQVTIKILNTLELKGKKK